MVYLAQFWRCNFAQWISNTFSKFLHRHIKSVFVLKSLSAMFYFGDRRFFNSFSVICIILSRQFPLAKNRFVTDIVFNPWPAYRDFLGIPASGVLDSVIISEIKAIQFDRVLSAINPCVGSLGDYHGVYLKIELDCSHLDLNTKLVFQTLFLYALYLLLIKFAHF